MAVRVRFAPSPTGSLHLGNALTAVANRRFADGQGGTFVLRIDDTDAQRSGRASADGVLSDLEWLGIGWDEGPIRQSDRADRHREAARSIGEADDEGALRFGRLTLLRPDGSPTYQLATAVDEIDLGITHVIRGADHRANTAVQVELIRALGAEPPEYVHHGLLLGDDGRKLSKRHGATTLGDLRTAGIPPEAARAYLDELDLPRHDVHLDMARLRRLAIEAIEGMDDRELAARVGVAVEVVPVLRGARNLVEARDYAELVLTPPAPSRSASPETLERFRELVQRTDGTLDERGVLRELKAVGGDLHSLRLALTGRERGPELWAVLAALPRDEALRRVEAAL
ncbi:MAG TPA: glutamate--tRNA ligase family protein [Gaiellaceae bacterium]|jgi:glutamyl/glutaminyl-tRNA synthetase